MRGKFNPFKPGDKVRFAHLEKGWKSLTVKALVREEPMLELEELPGQFAIHLFVAADYPSDSIVPRPKR